MYMCIYIYIYIYIGQARGGRAVDARQARGALHRPQ